MRLFCLVVLLLSPAAPAESLDALLRRGELTLLETWPDGRLRQATALGLVRAPPDVVFARLADFAAYPGWMPTVEKAQVTVVSPTVVDVDWSIAVVGPNVEFRGRYTLDRAARTIRGVQVQGALEGSRWDWELEPHPEGTLVRRVVYSNAVADNWVLQQVEDEHHSLDYGLNAATGVIELKGLKRALGVP